MSDLDLEIVNCFIDEALDLVEKWESVCLELEKNPNKDSWDSLFRMAHNLKGSSKACGLLAYGEFIHRVEDLITAYRDGLVPFGEEGLGILLKSQSVQLEWLVDLRLDINSEKDTQSLMGKINHILSQGQESLGSAENEISPVEDRPIEVATADLKIVTNSPQSSSPEQNNSGPKKGQESLRIAPTKIDAIIKLISEISIYQNIINHRLEEGQVKSHQFQNAIQLNTKLVKELQHASLSLRMNSVGGTFQRLERIAKDVSRELGKKIQIKTNGTEVELDKYVVDRIADPLTHIIRNAVDHGLESEEERSSKLKPLVGEITIEAIQSPSGVEIIISDDGKGLDTSKVLKKAMSLGLVGSNANLSEEQIFNLILAPGFSTAEKLTNISGRGVGMDVVKKAVEELNGHITIKSKINVGTSFVISLPTDLSIVDVLIVKLEGNEFAIPLNQIDEVVSLSKDSRCEFSKDQSALKIRGNVVPVELLKDYLKNTLHEQSDEDDEICTALVVQQQNNRVAFGIPKIIGKQTVVVRPLGKSFEKMKFFAGATILGNGEPSFIVDLVSIAKFYNDGIIGSKESEGAA